MFKSSFPPVSVGQDQPSPELISFFALSRPVQERFIGSLTTTASPCPILGEPQKFNRELLCWAGSASLALSLMVGFACIGFGDLNNPWALAPPSSVTVYAILACTIIYSTLQALHTWHLQRSLPFTPGTYLFPLGVVVAGPMISFHRLGTHTQIECDVYRRQLTLRMPGNRAFTFRTYSLEKLEYIAAELRQACTQKPAPTSETEWALLDPLRDTGYPCPLGLTEPLQPTPLPWVRYSGGVALAIGIPLGAALFSLRNFASDAELYRSACANNRTTDYQRYVSLGGHQRTVAEVLLPQAELRELEEANDLAALDNYTTRYPLHKNAAESAKTRLLLLEFDRVRNKGTLQALRTFLKAHPTNSELEPAITEHTARLLRKPLAHFEDMATDNQQVRDAFAQLATYCAHHGPLVSLRFQRKLGPALATTERSIIAVTTSEEKPLPSHAFDASLAETREKLASEPLLQALQRAFPEDLIQFQLGAHLTTDTINPGSFEHPTLLFSYQVDATEVFVNENPHWVYARLRVTHQFSLHVPGQKPLLNFEFGFVRRPDVIKLRRSTFRSVYEDLAMEALNSARRRFLTAVFAGP